MLTLITAQHFESLQTVLVRQLMQPGDNPLLVEPVLVPSTAVRRALSLAIADTHQVCAQVQFSFLAQWLWAQMAAVVPDIPADSPFDPDTLRWRLLRLFDQAPLLAAHPRLHGYLQDADAVMRFDLAGQLARLFDQYITYRQDWLAAWAGNRLVATPAHDPLARADEAWQAALWRALLADLQSAGDPGPGGHPVQRFLQQLSAGQAGNARVQGLPATVHVFCIPTMSPLYLQLLEGLAEHLDVFLYVLDPCREYWYDTVSQRYLAQRMQRGSDGAYAVGHRLLSAWGRQTQSFLQLLVGRTSPRAEISLPGAGAPAHTLLGIVQEGMVTLSDLEPGSLHGRIRADGSLQVHVCHGLVRELEVLHDHLLRCFAADATLQPADVLVVLPDLELAAPLIEAVFGQELGLPGQARRPLPFAITGLAPAASSPLAQALLAILEFAGSRMPLSGLLALLQQPLVAQGLGLEDRQVPVLAAQLQAAHVHWGLNPSQLRGLDLPEAAGHTLQEGLSRLLLGYALPDAHAGDWQGQLAAGNVEGGDALLLGVLQECVTRLGQVRAALAAPLTPDAWFRLLEQVLRAWLPEPARQATEHVALRGELQALQQELQAAAMQAALPAAVLLRALQERLQGLAAGGVATGAVTFAAMASLRALPFRHICVLGLDDGVFPAIRRPLDIDLLSAYPRLGDRQRSEDERNLFLDLLLAARTCLYLSYSGRSARDDSPRPPSVLLAELLDALVPALCADGADEDTLQQQRAALCTRHALQPFDARYFQAADAADSAALPRSFQETFAAALRRRADALDRACTDNAILMASLPGAPPELGAGRSGDDIVQQATADGAVNPDPTDHAEGSEDDEALQGAGDLAAPSFFTAPLPPPGPEWRQVTLTQLVQFLQHPARYLLRKRLGLALPAREDQWEDAEDFLPAFAVSQALARRVLPALLAGVPLAEVREAAAAGCEYPAGVLGARAREAAVQQMAQFAARIEVALQAPEAAARTGTLAFRLHEDVDGDWFLQGSTSALHAAQVEWRFHAAWTGDQLEAWVRHLWLCALAGQPGESPAVPTCWLFTDRTLFLPVVPAGQAHAQLAVLLRCYRFGLQQPLHFYPRAARALVEKNSLTMAQRKWHGSPPEIAGEGADRAWQLALRGVAAPLDEDFSGLANQIWGELHALASGLAAMPESAA